ncbi:MAG: ThiF family adenylyltransferase, partial [Myxococcales bacterium]|nr:ThiF family adenylyltransferase [Myxococcales bacterium]
MGRLSEHLGRNKAEVYEELLRSINPELEITTYREGVTEENVDAFMAPADLLVDCLDISVPLTLRTRVYRRAMEQGIYSVSAPIFGFGTLVLFSAPGGMGMDAIIERFVETASRDSKLPHGFGTYFFRPFVDAIERQIHTHRVPSSAISVV